LILSFFYLKDYEELLQLMFDDPTMGRNAEGNAKESFKPLNV